MTEYTIEAIRERAHLRDDERIKRGLPAAQTDIYQLMRECSNLAHSIAVQSSLSPPHDPSPAETRFAEASVE